MFMGTANATEAGRGSGDDVGLACGCRVGLAVMLGVGVRDTVAEGSGAVLLEPDEAVGGLAPGDAVGVGVALAMTGAGGGLGGVGVGGLVQAARSSRPTRSQPTPTRRFIKIRDLPVMFITHTDVPHNHRVPGQCEF